MHRLTRVASIERKVLHLQDGLFARMLRLGEERALAERCHHSKEDTKESKETEDKQRGQQKRRVKFEHWSIAPRKGLSANG